MKTLILVFALALSALAQNPTPAAAVPPTITKEALQSRLADLKKQYDQTLANLNATQGAIQDCEFWLQQFASPGSKPDAPKEPKAEEAKRPPAEVTAP